MASYVDARHRGGEWLVRIEDVDAPRTRKGADDDILRTLERYGFEWDGPVWRQSKRVDAYRSVLSRLVERGIVYRCACGRRELAALPIGRIGERVYPGTCRNGILAEHARRHTAVRIRVPPAAIEFDDRVFGRYMQHLDRDVGDFVVRRSDGLFAYQLAVVVDDEAQRITDVVRGADLLASTPRQIFLQHVLGFATPIYMHVPVAVDEHGAKFSKTTAAAALPDAPLSALRAAWRFLGQRDVPARSSVRDFWSWASAHWRVDAIPAKLVQPIAASFDH